MNVTGRRALRLPLGAGADAPSQEPDPATVDRRSATHVWAAIALIGIYVMLAGLVSWFIRNASANVPLSDTWNYMLGIAHFATTGQFPWHHVFDPYGQGRPLLGRLLMLGSARFGGFNVQVVKLTVLPFLVLEAVCLIRAIQLAVPRAHISTILAISIPAGLTVFSLANWQNWLQEWNVIDVYAVGLALLVLVLVCDPRTNSNRLAKYFLGAGASVCLVASFTGESGPLTWIVSLLVLWAPGSAVARRERIVFSAVAVLFLLAFSVGVPHSPISYALRHLGGTVRFIVIFLGNGVSGQFDGAHELGLVLGIGITELVLVGLLGIWLVRHPSLLALPSVRIGIGLIAFGCIGAVSTGLVRVQLGVSTATASRYVVIAAPVAIGIYLILVTLVFAGNWERLNAESVGRHRMLLSAAGILAATALLLSSSVADIDQVRAASARRHYFITLKVAACDPRKATVAQLSEFNNPGGMNPAQESVLLDEIDAARSAHLSLFDGTFCAGR